MHLQKAMADYVKAEARTDKGEPVEAVLVSAGRINLLRKAYPNYFLDTDAFLKSVDSIISRARSAANEGWPTSRSACLKTSRPALKLVLVDGFTGKAR